MSFVPFANVPEGIPSGKITAYVTSFEADGSDLGLVPDDTPDSIPLDGTITITPRVGTMNWPDLPKPQKSVMSAMVCPVIDGDLYRPGTTLQNYQDVEPGVYVIASEQPDAQPDKVQYEVRWGLPSARVQPPTTIIDVPAGGTVDLATVIPASPEPGTVIVVSTVDRERAEEAAERAELAAERAENASMGDIDYDLILGRVEPLVDDAVSEGLSGVGDLVSVALVPYATTSALTEGLAGKQPVGDYALVSQLPDTSGLATKTALASGLAEKQPVGDYATRDELPDVSGLATKTALASGLAGKQPVGDYATTAALTSGLAGKQPVGDYATKSELPDLTAYATTAYVDQTVGDIDTALEAILGD